MHPLTTRIALSIALLAALAAGPCGRVESAPAAPRLTVKDYFRLAPERYVGYDRAFREELLKGKMPGTTVDVPNGYLSYRATDNPESFEFAIFRKKDGRYVAAFSVPFDPDHPDAASRLIFLKYEGSKWTDVTRAVLPGGTDRRLTYRLPRRGRDIRVVNAQGRQVRTLRWVDGKFVLDRK